MAENGKMVPEGFVVKNEFSGMDVYEGTDGRVWLAIDPANRNGRVSGKKNNAGVATSGGFQSVATKRGSIRYSLNSMV